MAGALGEIDGLLTVKRQKEGLYLIGGKARIPAFWQTCGSVCCARVGGCERTCGCAREKERKCSLACLVGCIHARRANGRNEQNGTILKNWIYLPETRFYDLTL